MRDCLPDKILRNCPNRFRNPNIDADKHIALDTKRPEDIELTAEELRDIKESFELVGDLDIHPQVVHNHSVNSSMPMGLALLTSKNCALR